MDRVQKERLKPPFSSKGGGREWFTFVQLKDRESEEITF
jgi:hypothetical protein